MFLDFLLCPFMRAFDRYKIKTGIPKRSLTPQALSTRDFSKYVDPGILEDPQSFYTLRPPITDVETDRVEMLNDGCARRYVSFPTNCPVGAAENQRGYAVVTEPPEGVELIAGMFVVPGYGRLHLEAEKHVCHAFAKAGIRTIIVVLPFHMLRAPWGSQSGEYFLGGDAIRTADCFRQAGSEVRGLMHMIDDLPMKGILGVSLGGIIAHVLMTLHPFDFGISLIAGGRSAEIVWDGILTQDIRKEIEANGVDLDTLRRLWQMASPTLLARHVKTPRVLMLSAKFDQIIPVRYTEELWRTWGCPEIHWFPSAHYSVFFFIKEIERRIIDFVQRCHAEHVKNGRIRNAESPALQESATDESQEAKS